VTIAVFGARAGSEFADYAKSPPLLSESRSYVLSVSVLATDQIEVRLLHPDARPPARTRAGDAGYDLCCLDSFELPAGAAAKVPTGLALAIPPGVAGLILPRSGLAAKFRVTVVNAPGLVDPNYRGEVCVLLQNLGDEAFHADAGDRIAQLLLVPYLAPDVRLVNELPESGDDRGEGGFGSSGMRTVD
jgi:dUTP pyrophosphatase